MRSFSALLLAAFMTMLCLPFAIADVAQDTDFNATTITSDGFPDWHAPPTSTDKHMAMACMADSAECPEQRSGADGLIAGMPVLAVSPTTWLFKPRYMRAPGVTSHAVYTGHRRQHWFLC